MMIVESRNRAFGMRAGFDDEPWKTMAALAGQNGYQNAEDFGSLREQGIALAIEANNRELWESRKVHSVICSVEPKEARAIGTAISRALAQMGAGEKKSGKTKPWSSSSSPSKGDQLDPYAYFQARRRRRTLAACAAMCRAGGLSITFPVPEEALGMEAAQRKVSPLFFSSGAKLISRNLDRAKLNSLLIVFGEVEEWVTIDPRHMEEVPHDENWFLSS